jgi:hypothetical protein
MLAAAFFAIFALGSPTAAGQAPDGPYWTTIPVPAGFQTVTNIGTSGTIRSTGTVTFFSAVLRTFTSVPASPTAIISSFNDYCIVKDGTTVTAYCTRTGVASPLAVSPAATVTHGPASSSWTSVVIDGTQAWGYGAFAGSWAPLTLASPTPVVSAGNNCLVIWDGVQLHALSSLTSTWTSITPSEPIVGTAAGGFVGLAWGATTAWAFSNHRQTWTSHPFSAVGTPVLRDNYAYFNNLGLDFLFYSALTGTWAPYSTTAATGVSAGQNVAYIPDGGTLLLYASSKGVLVPMPVSALPTVYLNSEWVVVDDGGILTAFSGVTGTFAAPLPGTFTITGNEDVAFAAGASGSYAYSPIQNAWTAAPPGTPIQTLTVRNAVILVQPTGYDAFCTRTGTWSSITTAAMASYATLSNSATFVAFDGNAMSVFDSRLARWSTIATQAQPIVSIWRFTLLAHDTQTGYGFAMTTNVWETVPLAGLPIQIVANDSVGFIRTATQIHFYASLGSLSTISRYPEFSRMQARGSNLRFLQTGAPGSLITVAIATVGDYVPVPPYGIAFLDLSSIVGFVDLPAIPASGVLDLSIPIPDDPALNDVPVYLQDLITPPAAPPYVTNSISPIII